MALIFFMSAQDAAASSRMSGSVARPVARAVTPGFDGLRPAAQRRVVARVEVYVRKLAHGFEYAVLAALFFLALARTPLKPWSRALLSLCACALFAAGDEWHQRYVSGRGPALLDVGIDLLGALTGLTLLLLVTAALGRVRRRRETGAA